jgi:hypothetical protein
MHLVQLLLPLYDPAGEHLDGALFDQVARELTEHFGGVTAYARAPATGLWKEHPGKTTRDEIVVYEAMVGTLDPEWWAAYRRVLEKRFAQEEVVIRALAIQRL